MLECGCLSSVLSSVPNFFGCWTEYQLKWSCGVAYRNWIGLKTGLKLIVRGLVVPRGATCCSTYPQARPSNSVQSRIGSLLRLFGCSWRWPSCKVLEGSVSVLRSLLLLVEPYGLRYHFLFQWRLISYVVLMGSSIGFQTWLLSCTRIQTSLSWFLQSCSSVLHSCHCLVSSSFIHPSTSLSPWERAYWNSAAQHPIEIIREKSNIK